MLAFLNRSGNPFFCVFGDDLMFSPVCGYWLSRPANKLVVAVIPRRTIGSGRG